MLNLIALLTGLAGPVANLAGKLADLLIARTNATNNTERARIDQQIEEVHDKRAVLVAQAGNRFFSVVYGILVALLGLCAVVPLMKLLLWDKVIGSFAGYTENAFTTDRLGVELWAVLASIIGFLTVGILRK